MSDDLTPEEYERRLRLVQDHGLVDETGEWGEIVAINTEAGPVESEDVEVRNPVFLPELSAAERQISAVRMKAAGSSYRQIAESFGVTAHTAKRWVKDSLAEDLHENVVELRLVHYNRLERMLSVHWDRALAGDLAAFDRVGSTMDRIERLYGLSAPSKTEHTTQTRETIVIAEGDTETYLKALQQAAAQHDEIVDAELVEDE
jgi:hypothetical protein